MAYAMIAENLHKDYSYGYSAEMSDKTCSFRMEEGEFAVLFGGAASGKTTAARMIAGILPSDSGTVTLFGETFDAREAVQTGFRPGVAIAHEDPERKLDRKKRIGTIIGEPLRAAGYTGNALRNKVASIMELCRLSPDMRNRRPTQLSTGEMIRASIACAIAHEPRFLICDEITAAQSISNRIYIREMLRDYAKEHGATVLFITQDPLPLREIGTHFLMMKDGAILEEGTAEEVLDHPQKKETAEMLDMLREFSM
ncbi:MAG: ATP-binding cassette domain-containing protein [Lachnospiraceae bacterium]|nr:ATP-binding cassette domain-containing protein [Lachnospiraceae bacterium]